MGLSLPIGKVPGETFDRLNWRCMFRRTGESRKSGCGANVDRGRIKTQGRAPPKCKGLRYRVQPFDLPHNEPVTAEDTQPV